MVNPKPTIVVDFDKFVPSMHIIETYIDLMHGELNLNEEKEFRNETDDLALTEEEAQYLEELIKELDSPSKSLYI
ncbi:hypothetical protein [Candidatus Lokiarchaeum ossiferum]|uniref:hypothetical protein n=1 Tax=Candidatus Lokiarchaeum ossiferum TaxID=2951803 RepID=UPI00352CD56E